MNRIIVLCFILCAMAEPGSVLAAPPDGESLRVAVHSGAIRDISRVDLEVSLKLWTHEVSLAAAVPSEISFYQTMPEIHRDVEAGKINFIIADGVSMLQYFSPGELADGFGSVGKDEDSMLLVARKQAHVSNFKDLSGLHVALLAENEISDLWLETACLRTFHLRCAEAGVLVGQEKRSQQQVLKLFFNKADAALVRSRAYELALELNPQIGQQMQVIERVHMYPSALGLFTRRVSPEFRDYVISRIPKLQEHPRGRQIMEVLQTEKIGRVYSKLLDPIQALLREHEALSKRYPVQVGMR